MTLHFPSTKIVASKARKDSSAENAMMGFLTSHKKGLNKVVNTASGLFKRISGKELLISVPEKLAMLLSSSASALAYTPLNTSIFFLESSIIESRVEEKLTAMITAVTNKIKLMVRNFKILFLLIKKR